MNDDKHEKPSHSLSLNIHQHVADRYGQIAETGGACCGGGDAGSIDTHATAIGYTPEQLAELPEGANLGLGCGNPTTLTMIEPGMTVLDLGSGTGIDCFLAARAVGETGRVIGVDMTDAMLEKARAYAKEKQFTNIDFRKGEIEALPVEDNTVDLIISNCVVNLSPDKARVFNEAARVLRPGGRIAVSDIVLLAELPAAIREDVEAYIGCIAGAEHVDDYTAHITAAGLSIEKADRKGYDVMRVLGCSPEAGKLLEKVPADFDGNKHVASLDVVATKTGDA